MARISVAAQVKPAIVLLVTVQEIAQVLRVAPVRLQREQVPIRIHAASLLTQLNLLPKLAKMQK